MRRRHHRRIVDIAAIVEESSASSEEMSASAIEVSNSINSVTAIIKTQGDAAGKLVQSADDLQRVAQSLADAMARFKLDTATAPGGGSIDQAPHSASRLSRLGPASSPAPDYRMGSVAPPVTEDLNSAE